MKLEEIKQAVKAGELVHWMNSEYSVICDSNGQWLISCKNGSAIGLTWADNTTLNGKPEQFYIAQ